MEGLPRAGFCAQHGASGETESVDFQAAAPEGHSGPKGGAFWAAVAMRSVGVSVQPSGCGRGSAGPRRPRHSATSGPHLVVTGFTSLSLCSSALLFKSLCVTLPLCLR